MARSQMPDKKLRIVRTADFVKQSADAERQMHQPQMLRGFRKFRCSSKGQLKAVHGDQQKVWRIVYVANGLWQLQRFIAIEHNHEKPFYPNTESLWHAHSRPTDYETAHSQLKRRDHQIQASA